MNNPGRSHQRRPSFTPTGPSGTTRVLTLSELILALSLVAIPLIVAPLIGLLFGSSTVHAANAQPSPAKLPTKLPAFTGNKTITTERDASQISQNQGHNQSQDQGVTKASPPSATPESKPQTTTNAVKAKPTAGKLKIDSPATSRESQTTVSKQANSSTKKKVVLDFDSSAPTSTALSKTEPVASDSPLPSPSSSSTATATVTRSSESSNASVPATSPSSSTGLPAPLPSRHEAAQSSTHQASTHQSSSLLSNSQSRDSRRMGIRGGYLNAKYSDLESRLQNGATSMGLGLSARSGSLETRVSLDFFNSLDQSIRPQHTRMTLVRVGMVGFLSRGPIAPFVGAGIGYADFDVRSYRSASNGELTLRQHMAGGSATFVPETGVRISLGGILSVDLQMEYLLISGGRERSKLGGIAGTGALGFEF